MSLGTDGCLFIDWPSFQLCQQIVVHAECISLNIYVFALTVHIMVDCQCFFVFVTLKRCCFDYLSAIASSVVW